jgi:hypothetical protein
MPTTLDTLRATLRQLRNKVDTEAQRVRVRKGAPAELIKRFPTILHRIGSALAASSIGKEESVLIELYEDTVAEANLALLEWERWLGEADSKKQGKMPVGAERRVHTRHETGVTVRLLHHEVREDEQSVTLESETVSRPARNVSLGGMLVEVPAAELAGVNVGSVLHVLVSLPGSSSFHVRASVARREAHGIGLHWIQDSDESKKAVKDLLEAARKIAR